MKSKRIGEKEVMRKLQYGDTVMVRRYGPNDYHPRVFRFVKETPLYYYIIEEETWNEFYKVMPPETATNNIQGKNITVRVLKTDVYFYSIAGYEHLLKLAEDADKAKDIALHAWNVSLYYGKDSSVSEGSI